MQRKVIKQGKSTLTMSLPSSWIQKTGIKPGDALLVVENEDTLVIRAGDVTVEKSMFEIDLAGYSEDIVYAVIENLYLRGEEEIRISFDTERKLEIISEVVRRLLGFEIVEQCTNRCVLKELAKAEDEGFDMLLRRVFLLILSVAEDGVVAFKKCEDTTNIGKRDENVNILINYCLRVLNKHHKDAKHMYTLLVLLEKLADEYSRMYYEVKKVDKKTVKIAASTALLLREFYGLYYKFDKVKAGELKKHRDDIRAALNKDIEKTDVRDDIVALHHLRTIGDIIINIMKFQLAMQVE